MPSDEEGGWAPPRKTCQVLRMENHPQDKNLQQGRTTAPQGLRHQLTPSPGGFFNKQMGKKNTFSLAQLQLWQALQSQMGLPGGAGASAGLSLFPGPSKQHCPESQSFPESQQNVLQGPQ